MPPKRTSTGSSESCCCSRRRAPVTEVDADDAADTERAELELAATVLLKLAVQGNQTDDELMVEIQTSFEALDEAVTTEELAGLRGRARRAGREANSEDTRAALEKRY